MNPYLLEAPALIAFSGGRTSAFMLRQILDTFGGTLPEGLQVCFCNTGLEHPQTLIFVQRCAEEWGVKVVWLEYRFDGVEMASQNPVVTFAEVDFETASRKGEPFSQLIRQRSFLPNPVTRFCTVELKIQTMHRWALAHGIAEYTKAIGLRYDEPRRVHKLRADRKGETVCCPMYDARHTVEDVEKFWGGQPFKLEIPFYQGNCQGCFLKSRWRLDQVARETPEAFQWWIDWEYDAATGVLEHARSHRFRNDRASYGAMLRNARDQMIMFPLELRDLDNTVPCDCTD